MSKPYNETLTILNREIGKAPKYNDLRKDGTRRLQWTNTVLKFDEIHGLTEYLKSEGLSGVDLKNIQNKNGMMSVVAEIPENIVTGRTTKVSSYTSPSVVAVFFRKLNYVIAATLAVTLTLSLLPFMYLASLVTNRVTVSGTKIYVRNMFGSTIFGVGFGFNH